MAHYRITLTLEGLASDDGHVPLSAFLHEVQAFVSVIARADLFASGGHQTVRARVVDLRHSSPAAMTVELLARNVALDTRPRLIATLAKAEQIREDVDAFGDRGRELLESIKELAEPVGRHIKSAALAFDSGVINLTKELQHQISAALAPMETSVGTIEGRLEAINIHDEANTFHIYPAVGPARIKGTFPTALRDKAVAAVDRNVLVSGTLKYRVKSPYPYEIEVQEFLALPNDDELPKMTDLFGIAPNATDGVPSETFVRKIRDDWR